MAFITKGNKIIMDAYDFGLQLPFDISNLEFEENDKIVFELKKSKNSNTIIRKEFSNRSTDKNTFRFFLEFTKNDTENLYPGNYVYYLKHIRDDEVRNTLISGEDFKIKNG